MSKRFLVPFDQIPRDPEEAYSEAVRRIRKEGWKFYTRSAKTKHGRKFTMTLRYRIGLNADWEKMILGERAVTLWHELVHIKQRKAWGHTKFEMRYLGARGRFCIEVPAYRMSIRAYERLTGNRFNGAEYILKHLPAMRRAYWLKSIRSNDYERVAGRAWNSERR